VGWAFVSSSHLDEPTAGRLLEPRHRGSPGLAQPAMLTNPEGDLEQTGRRSGRRGPRPVSARRRRRLARWLRRTASRALDPDPRQPQSRLLLRDRAAAVCGDLLEIADSLERTDDPDRQAVEALLELLRNGCNSPLYNANVHESELRATLYYARAALLLRREQPREGDS
jgi:hypothetical protein